MARSEDDFDGRGARRGYERAESPALPLRGMIDAARRQALIIFALVVREFRLRSRDNPFRQLIDAASMLVIVGAHMVLLLFFDKAVPYGDSDVVFICSGLFPILFFRLLANKVIGFVKTSGRLGPLPMVHPLDYVFALAIVDGLTLLFTFVCFFLVLELIGISRYATPFDPIQIAIAIAFAFPLAIGVGLVNAHVIFLFPVWRPIWMMISRLQMIFAAVFFLPERLPPLLRTIIWYNPASHIVALVRTAFYPAYPTFMISLPYLGAWVLFSLLIGLAMQKSMRSRLAEA